jgi:hypothetical protein
MTLKKFDIFRRLYHLTTPWTLLERLGFYCILQYINSTFERIYKLSKSKSETLTFRIKPELKEGLRAAASLEHRSISNMVEKLIRDHCAQNGISIVEPEMRLVEDEHA